MHTVGYQQVGEREVDRGGCEHWRDGKGDQIPGKCQQEPDLDHRRIPRRLHQECIIVERAFVELHTPSGSDHFEDQPANYAN